MLIGFVAGGGALVAIFALAFWCRKIINRIGRRGYGTARETLKELK